MNDRPLITFAIEYPIALGGGVSVLVSELLRGLHPQFRLALISRDSPEEIAQSQIGLLLERHLSWPAQRADRTRSKQLSEIIAEWGTSLAHFHLGENFGWSNRRPGTSPIPFLNRRRIPSITTVHLVVSPLHGVCSPLSPIWFKTMALAVSWFGKMHALAHTSAEVAVSEHDRRLLSRWYWPMRKRIQRIYHSRLSINSGLGIPPNAREKIVLHVGHRAFRKGQPVLVEAFARIASRHPDWKLVLIGPSQEESCERRILELISKFGMQHRIEVLEDRSDVAAWMRRAALYVQPSLQEALGLALQEALFYGCACIGTRVGGIPEMIDHGESGFLVEPGNVESLSSALDRLMGNSSLREQLGVAGADAIRQKEMSAEKMIEQYIGLYERALRGR